MRSQLYLNYEDYGRPDAPMRIDYYLWVVRGWGRTVLVDLGFAAGEAARRGRVVTCPPVDAWRALGVEPRRFDGDIVLTHGHWDHTGHIDHFPRARFLMSRTEYEFWLGDASSPHLFRHLAHEADLAALVQVHAEGRLQLVDPPYLLAPGIQLHAGAGHTPGLLMVEVATADGGVLLASDAVHFDEELACDMPFRHMTNLEASYATFAAIRGRGLQVLAGHEPGVIDRFPRIAGPLDAHACVVGATSHRPGTRRDTT